MVEVALEIVRQHAVHHHSTYIHIRLAENLRRARGLFDRQPLGNHDQHEAGEVVLHQSRANLLELPVLVGLLPLASYRNAEFLHNEVPGMQVPDDIRERMRRAGSGADARKEGVAIAREMLAAVRHRVAGAYVMPPLERYELALEVIDGFLDPT